MRRKNSTFIEHLEFQYKNRLGVVKVGW